MRGRGKELLLIFDSEVEEGEEGGVVVGFRGVEHGDEVGDGLGEVSAGALGGFGEAADFAGGVELGIGVVGLDEMEGADDGGVVVVVGAGGGGGIKIHGFQI